MGVCHWRHTGRGETPTFIAGLAVQWVGGCDRVSPNLPEPTIEELVGRVRFTVPLPEILPLTREQSRKGNGKDLSARSAVESGLESLAARILSSLAESALSKAELAKALGHSSISSKLNQRVNQLLDLDFIERTIPQKPNSRLQKYRLTTRGRRMRNQSL